MSMNSAFGVGGRIDLGLSRDELLALRKKFPSLQTEQERRLRNRRQRLEEQIRMLEPQGGGQRERRELSSLYSELRKHNEDPLYGATFAETARYKTYYDLQTGRVKPGLALSDKGINLWSYRRATEQGRVNGFDEQSVVLRGSGSVRYGEANRRIGEALGIHANDVPKLVGQLDKIPMQQQGGGQAVAALTPKQVRELEQKQARDREREARLNRPGTIEHGFAAVKRAVPSMKPGQERAVRIFLEGAGGVNDIPAEALQQAIAIAKAGQFDKMRSVGATMGALRDPKKLVERILRSGYHVGHLLQGAQPTRFGRIDEAMRVVGPDGNIHFYGDALKEISKSTGFSIGELQTLFAGKSQLTDIYRVLKGIAAEQFASEKDRGISDRALAYGKQRGTLGNDHLIGLREHTIRNNRDLHLLGDAEEWGRYAAQGFNDPVGTLLSSVDSRSPDELAEWEKVLRHATNFAAQYAAGGVFGKLFTVASKGLAAAPKVGGLLQKGAASVDALNKSHSLGSVVFKGGLQQLGGMVPDAAIQARISQNTTGKGFLEAFGEAGMGQLRELVSTKYLTGVDENGNPIGWGDRVIGASQQLLTAAGAMGIARRAMQAGNVTVPWPKEWLAAKARQFKVDPSVMKGMLDKAVGELKGVLNKPVLRKRGSESATKPKESITHDSNIHNHKSDNDLNEQGIPFTGKNDAWNLEFRKDTSDKAKSVAINEFAKLSKHGTVYFNAVVSDYRDNRSSAFVGKRIESINDVVSVSQHVRNPRLETSHIVMVRDGNVVAHMAISSRLVGSTAAFGRGGRYEVDRMLTELRADSMYLIHNHPSGDPYPSRADLEATTYYINSFESFKGHIITNHGRFRILTRDNVEKGGIAVPVDNKSLTKSQSEVPHYLRDLFNIEDAIEINQMLNIRTRIQEARSEPVLIGLSSKRRLRTVAQLSPQLYTLGNENRFAAAVSGVAKASGSRAVIMALRERFEDVSTEDLGRMKRAVITNVIGTSWMAEGES